MAAKSQGHRSTAKDARHESFLRHARHRWLKIGVALSLGAIILFMLLYEFDNSRLRHFGGTWYGYTLGTIGALLILWLTALGIRKRAMTDGNWSLKAWVSAHIYLGLSLLVVASLHSGFQFGLNIHTLAYALMVLVIVSGIFGVLAYAYLPTRLSTNRAETTEKQMVDRLLALDSHLADAAQPLEKRKAKIVLSSLESTWIGGGIWQRVTGWYPRCPTHRAQKKLKKMRRAAPGDQAALLDQIINLLEQKNAVLGKSRRHIRLRAVLQIWLYVHVPTTFALIAALSAHIVSVFFYW